MIKHDLKLGEELYIGGAKIKMVRKSGQVCSLIIDAPADVVVRTPKSQRKEKEACTPQEAV